MFKNLLNDFLIIKIEINSDKNWIIMFFTQVKEPFLKNCISQSALSTPKSLSVHKKTFV